MRVLALDTTTRAGSVAIVEDDRVLVERDGNPERSHVERVPIEIIDALNVCALRSTDIDIFAVAVGPGSFTGLRIGIATIQGLAVVTGKRVVAVSALAALAEAGSATLSAGDLVAAWMDAHRRQAFSALYRVTDASPFAIERLAEVEAASVDDPQVIWTRWQVNHTVPHVLIGDGATLFAEIIQGSRVEALPRLAPVIGLMAVARARAGETVDPAGVQPLYVRRPDVELAREKVQ